MTGWTPLYQQIIGSSIWEAPDHIRIAWITMLAISTKDGIATVTTSGLARLANISLNKAQDAIKVLSSPDADTLTQENEGRRIERCENGWRLLNFQKYRDMAKKAALREYNAAAQARHREKKKQPSISDVVKWDSTAIYNQYPRRIGKPKALAKISKAIDEFGADKVMEATKLFAEAWKGEKDLTFCPHPATWFGQHRFNDDPATWVRNGDGVQKSGEPKDIFWKDKAKLDLIDAEIKSIDARASHTAMDVIYEPGDAEKRKRLRSERTEIKERLGL